MSTTTRRPIEVNDQVTVLSGVTVFDVVRFDGDMARIWPVDGDGDGHWISRDLLRHAPAKPSTVATMAELADAMAKAMDALHQHWSVNVYEVDEAIGRTGYPFAGLEFGELTAQVQGWAERLRADAADPQ